MKYKNRLINLFIVFITIIICLIIAEFGFRAMIFSNNNFFKSFKEPGAYANPNCDDDYWKLYYRFSGDFKPPKNPHPLFGWIGYFDRKTLIHNEILNVQRRRPVLLYGNSFSQCASKVQCFEHILNSDQEFSKDHYLLNYGVGGYGFGQIYLLFKQTYSHYKNPIIVFGLLLEDLDRSILSVRTGQKPYFKVKNDSLVLCGIPINPNAEEFFENNPPQITSYLYRKFLYGNLNFLSENMTKKLKKTDYYTNLKIDLNKRIIQKVIDELKSTDTDFIILIFHSLKWGGAIISQKKRRTTGEIYYLNKFLLKIMLIIYGQKI